MRRADDKGRGVAVPEARRAKLPPPSEAAEAAIAAPLPGEGGPSGSGLVSWLVRVCVTGLGFGSDDPGVEH